MRSDAPGKLSAFTGKADFYESLYFLEDIYQKVRPLSAIIHQDSLASTEKPTVAAPVAWLNQSKMSDHLGFGLSLLQYRKVVAKLTQLVPHPLDLPELIAQETSKDSSNPSLSSLSKSAGHIDSLGRVVAFGARKSARAKVYLVPGEGHLMVNGRLAHEYFGSKMIDMFRLAEPFRVTRTFGKYNIWALVRGGGTTGQSGAIALAISRALTLKDPKFGETLTPLGLLNRDIRRVERKKPGQPKARKKFTWVKR